MTTTTIQKRISRAIELKQIISGLEDELKEIKTELTVEAEGRAEEHAPTDVGGWSWRFCDIDNNQVCVTKPGDRLKGKLDPEAKGFARIKEVAGRAFMQLFIQTPSYRPVEDFRIQALAHLSKDDAKKLIKLVTTESAPQVAFEVSKTEGA